MEPVPPIELELFVPTLMVVNWPNRISDESLLSFLAHCDRVRERGLAHADLYLALTGMPTFTARQRKTIGEWAKQWAARDNELCRGVAYVIPGSIGRGVVTAVMWVAGRGVEYPQKVIATVEEGIGWLHEIAPEQASATTRDLFLEDHWRRHR